MNRTPAFHPSPPLGAKVAAGRLRGGTRFSGTMRGFSRAVKPLPKRLLAALLVAAPATMTAVAAKRPHLVFILADDVGGTDLTGGHTTSGGGSDFHQTPNLSRLAS